MSKLVKELSDVEFASSVTDKDACLGLVLVDFWAPWCQPCLQLAPFVEEAASLLEGKVQVYKVNVDSYKETAMQYQVRNIPTVLLFKDGVLVDRRVGGLQSNDVQELVAFISKHI